MKIIICGSLRENDFFAVGSLLIDCFMMENRTDYDIILRARRHRRIVGGEIW